jgi:alpha-galactosidase
MQPVQRGFDQRNFMGMNASDYGGGTRWWTCGAATAASAIGHVDTVPRLVRAARSRGG